MQITMKVEYAIILLAFLAVKESEDFISSKDIVANTSIPSNLVSQLSAKLSKQGWIEGKKGVGGGLRLVVAPKNITIKDVIETINSSFTIKKCLADYCERKTDCHLNSLWNEAQNQLNQYFQQITIEDLISGDKSII